MCIFLISFLYTHKNENFQELKRNQCDTPFGMGWDGLLIS